MVFAVGFAVGIDSGVAQRRLQIRRIPIMKYALIICFLYFGAHVARWKINTQHNERMK